MKLLGMLVLFCTSVTVFASSPFVGHWSGNGTFSNYRGTQTCTYNIDITEVQTGVSLESIYRLCDSNLDYYGCKSYDSHFYDVLGNQVGDFTSDTIHILLTNSQDSYSNEITLQLLDGVINFTEKQNWKSNPTSDFSATASLKL